MIQMALIVEEMTRRAHESSLTPRQKAARWRRTQKAMYAYEKEFWKWMSQPTTREVLMREP